MLAIVIPFYKLAFFEATIQSLANQTDKRFKVYIGDDASVESPIELLDKYKGGFDFVYHRFDRNLGSTGLTKQWERCIALSGNEQWVMLLGDDDYLDKNVVREFYNNSDSIVENKVSIVRFASRQIIEGEFSKLFVHPKLEKSTDFFFRKLSGETRSSLSEYIFHKDKLLEVGFMPLPLAWYADDMAILDVSDFSNVYSINEACVFITISEWSISGEKRKLIGDKNGAELIFFNTLIEKHKNRFSKKQHLELINALSRSYLKCPNSSLFFRIVLYFVYQGAYRELLNFWRLEKKRFIRMLKVRGVKIKNKLSGLDNLVGVQMVLKLLKLGIK